MVEIKDQDTQPGGPLLAEAGAPGAKRYGGTLDEEWHPRLLTTNANKIYRQMYDNDGFLGGACRAIQFLIRQAPWMIETRSGESSPQHVYWKDRIEAALFHDLESTWSEVLMSILSVMPFGWSCMWQSWKICRGENKDRIFDSQYADGLLMFRDLEIRAQETLQEWIYDEDLGKYVGWVQLPPPRYKRVNLYSDRYMHFRVDPNKGSPEGRSMFRNAYRDWFFGTRFEEVRGVAEERNLAGLPVLEVPPEIMHPNATDAQAAIRTDMEQKVQKIRRDQLEGLVFPAEIGRDGKPTGYKIRLLNAGGRNTGTLNDAIKDHRRGKMVSFLSEMFLVGLENVGALAMSKDKREFFELAIGAVMDMICDVFNRQGIPRVMRANQVPRDLWPELRHGEVDPEDSSKVIAAMAQAIQTGLVVATEEDEKHARDILNWPQREAGSAPLPSPQMADQLLGGAMAQAGAEFQKLEEQPTEADTVAEPSGDADVAMTVDEAADKLKVSRGTIMSAIRSGRLPGARVGQGYRIMPDHLQQFMRGGAV